MSDKLGAPHTFRITDRMHKVLDGMSKELKAKMNAELRDVTAKYCHLASFNPKEWHNSADEVDDGE